MSRPSGWNHSDETKHKISIKNKGRRHSEEYKIACRDRVIRMFGEKSRNWKGGVSWDTKYQNKKNKERRHRLGISKKYHDCFGIRVPRKYYRKKYKYLKKNAGELTIRTIQMIYEDNIKKYGTLTCYLCHLPIEFNQDSLEHKTPLSRGGDNSYGNLDIAHRRCNSKKYKMTEDEYRSKYGI